MLISDESNIKSVVGMRLPIPYVEKATVNNGNITVIVGLYLLVPADQSIEDSTDYLKNMHFYIGQVFDGMPFDWMSTITYSESELESGTQRMGNLLAGGSVMDLLIDITNSNNGNDAFMQSDETQFILSDHKDLISLTIDDFMYTDDELIANDDSEISMKVIKFITDEQVLTCKDHLANTNVYFDSLERELTVSLICFSSVIDLSGMTSGDGNSHIEAARENLRHRNLYKSMFSQASFKTVFINGQIETTPIRLFVLPNKKIYNGNVMQAIDGTFYTTEATSKDNILSRLEALMPSEEYIMNSAAGMQAALTSYRAIISIYKDTEELLPRLQVFSQTFVDKTTSTQAGNWYQKFNARLIAIDAELMNKETALISEHIITPTVVDGRTIIDDAYEQPEVDEYNESDFIYAVPNSSMLMTRIADYGSGYGESIQPSELHYNYTLIENGFFFFDYEKAVRTQSVASKVINLSQIEQLLGGDRSYINKYFKLRSVSMYRKNDENDGIYDKTTTFTDSLEDMQPLPEEMGYFTYSDSSVKKKYEYNDQTIYPSLTIRNVSVPENETFSDYRLMCFEFQDIMDSAGSYYYGSNRDRDTILIDVRFVDYSRQLVTQLTSSYMDYLNNDFNDYFEAAEEFCSYNNIDGYFNDFFINAMNERYSGSADTVPWIAGPALYSIHKDLLTGIYNGDYEQITRSSIIISEQISPETGDIENLRNFRENFESLAEAWKAIDLDSYDASENLLFSTSLSISDFAKPEILNYEPSGEVSFDSAHEEWISTMKTSLEQFQQDMINLLDSEMRSMDEEAAADFVNVAYRDAKEILAGITVLADIFEDERYDTYTPEELGSVIFASLTAAGVSSAFVTAFVLGGIAMAGGFAVITVGAAFALAAPVILVILAIAGIIAAIAAALAKKNRRELTTSVEAKIYDFITKLLNQASDIRSRAGGASGFPTNSKDALMDCFSNHPELTYGMFLFLVAFYVEIDPDGEDKVGAAVETTEGTTYPVAQYAPTDTAGIEDIVDFILSRAIPNTGG